MIGNRLPTLDPRTAGIIGQSGRKVSETRGMIGNRLPSLGSSSYIAQKAGSTERSASPSGSVDSSNASGPAGSSPITSTNSSPHTSPGLDIPSSLLSATLPDNGGPGAMTPSSTIAEAGEETSQLSVPSTPVAAATQLPPPEYDLVPGNLSLAEGRPTIKSRLAPSVSSSNISQFDSGSHGSEDEKKMNDVSGISTPMGTPRAAHRDFEGSIRGEGSVRGDESVRGEGSVSGDASEGDMEELSKTMSGLGVAMPDRDRDITPEPPAGYDELATPMQRDDAPPVTNLDPDRDPNEDPDLDALKAGDLHRDKTVRKLAKNPVNSMAEVGFEQNLAEHQVAPSEEKEQNGAAGQTMPDVESPSEVEPPQSRSGMFDNAGQEDVSVKDASPVSNLNTDDDKGDRETLAQRATEIVGADDPEKAPLPPPMQDKVYVGPGELDQSDRDLERHKRNEEGKGEASATEEGVDTEAKPFKPDDPIVVTGAPEEERKKIDEGNLNKTESGTYYQELKDVEAEAKDRQKGGGSGGQSEVVKNLEAQAETDTDAEEPTADRPSHPIQVHIEPAPIAQPAEEPPHQEIPELIGTEHAHEASDFPEPPHNELDPPGISREDNATPLDPKFVRSFPEVPDEDKPRVEVHVSPHVTPAKPRLSMSEATSAPDQDSQSLTPPTQDTAQFEGSPSTAKPSKRLSARPAPKSPLLGDEDPGDFEQDMGWAVVTQ